MGLAKRLERFSAARPPARAGSATSNGGPQRVCPWATESTFSKSVRSADETILVQLGCLPRVQSAHLDCHSGQLRLQTQYRFAADVMVNVLDHLYRSACFAYAFHSAPRLSGGAAGPSRSAGLCVQCTSSTPTWRLAPLYRRSPLGILRICAFLGTSYADSLDTPVHGLILS